MYNFWLYLLRTKKTPRPSGGFFAVAAVRLSKAVGKQITKAKEKFIV